MKKKTIFSIVSIGVLVILFSTYAFVDLLTEPRTPRGPASAPSNYENLRACDKQNILWQEAQASIYKELPDYRPFGVFQLIAMSKQEIAVKGKYHSDFAPEGWKKYLHGRGAMAKVKIVPRNNSKYTGVFQGADCGFLRLSLTYKVTGSRPVAPGLALKVLRDGTSSANISALVSLDGQAKDYDFFKYPMSNIVPVGQDFGQKMVHRIFNKVSRFPEELLVEHLASVDAHGQKVSEVVAPRQIFFVAGKGLDFPSTEHDVREDFLKIPADTVIYHIFAAPEKYQSLDYVNSYQPKNVGPFLRESAHIADIVTTSEFIASEFVDDGIFFRHQLKY